MRNRRALGELVALVLLLPPLAALMGANSGGDSASPAALLTLLLVELVVAGGLVLAWKLRRWLPSQGPLEWVPISRRRGSRGL